MSGRRAIALLAGALVLAGCGSSSSGASTADTPAGARPATAATTQPGSTVSASTATGPKGSGNDSLKIASIDPSKFLRGSSVGFGQGPAPSLSPTVRKAAKAAGCRLRSDASAVGIHLLISDLRPLHVASPDYSKQPLPPTNGLHYEVWANWGFYNQPIPYKFEVHDLEHGGVVVHLGARITNAQGTPVVRMWAASPPYLLIVPGLPADVPVHGATVTSWQRAMICKTWNARTLAAIRTYRDAYRGTGPEQIPSLDSGSSLPGLPTPVLPDPTA